MRIILISLCLFLAGCGGNVEFIRDTEGTVTHINTKGTIEATYKTDKEEITASSKPDYKIFDFNLSKLQGG